MGYRHYRNRMQQTAEDRYKHRAYEQSKLCSNTFFRLKQLIKYRAERIGIRVIEQEESYTSVSSFIDRDILPVYGTSGDAEFYAFSGRRITRGLYKTKNGMLINADLNGAANIMRKWCSDIFERTTLPNFAAVEVINYPHCKCK